MLFNTYIFICYLLIVITLYYSSKSDSIKKYILLIASYVFYAAWNPYFVLLLLFSTVVDWFAGKAIYNSDKRSTKKNWLAVSLFVNLGLLAFFKYGNWIVGNLSFLSNSIGGNSFSIPFNIILPVGISFYTFQTLSYSLDIYYGRLKSWDSILEYALYVSFFPQLVAGPIVRAIDFLPQTKEKKVFFSDEFHFGIWMLIFGLFEKVVIADNIMSRVANSVYTANCNPDFTSAWLGTFAFSFQIFCDFSGYSLCAIGVAKMLGYDLPVNFRWPYAADSFSDFWKRWHISLSSWLKDYLYIPLGGNRTTKAKVYRNLLVVMILGGLWHGAAWTFLFWGFLHGLYLAIEKYFNSFNICINNMFLKLLRSLLVYLAVCIAWVFFRADSFGQAAIILKAMAGMNHDGEVMRRIFSLYTICIGGSLLIAHHCLKALSLKEIIERLPASITVIILTLCLLGIILGINFRPEFIYFQF